jgi:hypothetical protein
MEKWSHIQGFDYEVSNLGRVRSLSRMVHDTTGRARFWPSKVLRPGISKQLGYQIVILRKDKKGFTKYVHLLVAAAFLPPKPAGMEINHKDGVKSNPHFKNLEWNTHSQNMQHSVDIGLRKVFSINWPRTKNKKVLNPNGTLQTLQAQNSQERARSARSHFRP